ncbi:MULTISPECIES: hypothetical protein [Lysobacter]|jgi:hypothetical protein|uniref:Uncharacterized protein n=2 Tax=Lysobacter gummosus TaxID=262324 RepID=A0ABY3XF67_9GAMM|nr:MULTISPECIES: hypothetical protein [Lysobacter]ALN89649.1 hypothetical protein LG3211_0664 [Lysobacter gummosus]UJB18441.1 hypothetical protein L1A79_19220 [Lysobacter capsici]UJQ27835.1 hypothetical protein L2D09_20665 [Lysobacter gummosus]UNP30275.1 hypothetical protein MOV92_03055 [Lysobacter gummosus]
MPPRYVDWLSSSPESEPGDPASASAAAISHHTRELAITYGIGARLHHGERHWDDIRDELARGWERLRGTEQVPWTLIEDDVEGAWRLVLAD